MKFADAEILPQRIYEYCLDLDHPDGEHKVVIFKSALGIDKSNAEELIRLLRESLTSEELNLFAKMHSENITALIMKFMA